MMRWQIVMLDYILFGSQDFNVRMPGYPQSEPPRGLLHHGKSPTLVIVDEIHHVASERLAADFEDVLKVTASVNNVEQMMATLMPMLVSHVTKEKGPRKRSGGKWRSKWDRWG